MPLTQGFAPASLGTWMWDAMEIMDPQSALDFLVEHHVTEVYLAQLRAMPKDKYRTFIRMCSQQGIRVGLIGADARWALAEGGRQLEAFFAWFQAYQQGCADDSERFYGIHMDVEPHQLPQWSEDQDAVVAGFTAFLEKSRVFCDQQGVLLEADIPFWFDGFQTRLDGQEMTLSEATLRLCDSTLLMSYRDNAAGVLACADTEIPLAKSLGKRLVLAVETGKIYEEINITFHHLGTQALYRELQDLAHQVQTGQQAGEIGELGYAIHYFQAWRALPPQGHPKGPDYPYAD